MADKAKTVMIAVVNSKTGIEYLIEVEGELLTRVHSGDPLPPGYKTLDGKDASGFIWTGRNFIRE